MTRRSTRSGPSCPSSIQGTLAEQVVVPARNVVAKPSSLSWEEAACLPTAFLTAYRMLATRSGLRRSGHRPGPGCGRRRGLGGHRPGQGDGPHRVLHVPGRRQARRALTLGADLAVEPGERLPEKVDVVIETVGDATWSHSLRALRPGGRVVVCGATSGPNPPSDLNRVFFLQLSVIGSTMGTREELEAMLALLDTSGVRPVIDDVRPCRTLAGRSSGWPVAMCSASWS